MYLESISIKNFRLFKELDLKFNQGLNVLVGENDSGKTALVDAIRYTLGATSSDRSYVAETDFHGEENSLSIQLKFSDVDAHAYRFVEHLSHDIYKDQAGEDKSRSVLYVQLSAEKTGTERRGYPYIKSQVRSGKDGNGLSIEAEIRDFLATTYLKPLRDASAELSSGRASRLSQILSSSKDIRDGTDKILSTIAEANRKLLADNEPLKKSAERIQNDYLHELVFEDDKESLGAFIDIAGVKADDLDAMPANAKRRYLRAVLEGLSLALTKDRRLHGLGYHNLLFMAAELLLLEQEASNEFPLLLIEEPEAHLHPQLQMKLLQFINAKIKSEAIPEGIQCILTTHSPNLSSKADPSEIIILGGGGASALRPDETELAPDDYKYLRKFLDATKANVFFSKGLLFVEGDGENILLPEIARLLGRPLENYGVSIVKYDNSGSWKRFAKLFLRKGKDDESESDTWPPTKVCVIRDLDLWPDCAEARDDNPYGFLDRKEPQVNGRGGNLHYWEKAGANERDTQIQERKVNHKKDKNEDLSSLERQRIKVHISNRWTFEFCLARYGLFAECYEAVNGSREGIDAITGTDDEKATYIQSKVAKTDFAYDMAKILNNALEKRIADANEALGEEERENSDALEVTEQRIKSEYANELKGNLPPYIVKAIEYVTASINLEEQGKEVMADAKPT